ncbi:MAG: sulfite exporter TauE/SafE family protein [Phycisphaerales bacterium]|nr:MAG: sulfite exporter TauE/SafE family protein [Phycisphaerales bacterium]
MTPAKGFLLGIANGAVCLGYCAPVLVPYLLGEGKSIRGNTVSVGSFLAGRLAGYMLFAVLAWVTHFAVVDNLPYQRTIVGIVTIGLALSLVAYGFSTPTEKCTIASAGPVAKRLHLEHSVYLPMFLGFLTGLNICPPFLLAFADAAQLSHLWQSLLFFAAFFAGTSVYIVFLPLLSVFRRHTTLKTIGRLAAGVVGLAYLYYGAANLLTDPQ